MVDGKETQLEETESNFKRFRSDDLVSVSILNEFKFVKVLNDNSQSKMIIIQAEKKQSESETDANVNNMAVIIFEKPHFSLDATKAFLSVNSPTEIYISNDIYKKLSVYPTRPYNSKFKSNLIYRMQYI